MITTPSLLKPKKILVIRRDNIGDLVCTTPALSALRRHYPDAQICVLVNSYNAEVLRGNPSIDKVFVYQKLKHANNLLKRVQALILRIQLILSLRIWKPDAVILAKSSYDRHGLRLARQLGAKNVVGFMPNNKGDFSSLPDIKCKPPKPSYVHEVEAVNQLLAPLGIYDALGPMQVFPQEDFVTKATQSFPASKRRIALHISAREAERHWGLSNFVNLTQAILASVPDVDILLFWAPGKSSETGHPGDDESAAQLLRSVDSPRLVPAKTSSITELVAALSLCDLFIGTDGGAMHLAAALKMKTIALFERSQDKLNHWYPWKTEHRMIFSAISSQQDVAGIEVDQVLMALNDLLVDDH